MTAQPHTHALVQELSDRLARGTTVTEALFEWCEEHDLSRGPIAADCLQRETLSSAPAEVMEVLGPAAGEAIGYRKVRLMRGGLSLAIAKNWFLPERLPPAMAETLALTDLPFGTVVAPLSPFRQTLSVHHASAVGRSTGMSERVIDVDNAPIILQQTAVVLSRAGVALAFVKEDFLSTLC